MTTHLRLNTLALGLLSLAAASPASAVPDATIPDTYWGATDHGYGDVIGNSGDFGITKAEVSLAGTWLTVDIFTGFAGKAGTLFRSSTRNPETHATDGKGIGYGDLFLALAWDPHAEPPPGGNADFPRYNKDDSSNGTRWTYAISLGDALRWTSGTMANQAATLYGLVGATNDANGYLSDDYFGSGVIWRNKQMVAVDTVSNSSNVGLLPNSASFAVNASFLRFEVDLAGTSLAGKDQLALHWGPTCANDVIEGEALDLPRQVESVPEPATLALMGLGIAGIGFARRKRAHG